MKKLFPSPMRDFIRLRKKVKIWFFALNLFCFIPFLLTSQIALAYDNGTFSKDVLIGNFFSSNNKSFKVLAVEKSSKSAFLVKMIDNKPEIVMEFNNILTGETEGDKVIEGDKKTPEGIYYITSFIPGEELPEIYGFGAFPLNYPNFYDKIAGKTGYGIWIHGKSEKNPADNATEGCVAIANKEMKRLKEVNFINTPIVITENLNFMSPDQYFSQRALWINYLKSFISAWESNSIDEFQSYIHTNYRNKQNEDYYDYILEKKKLMEIYPYREINIKGVKIFVENDSEAVFGFNQLYCADNIISEGKKKLYLAKELGEFKIIAEDFKPDSSFDMAKNITKSFVKKWRGAWESQKIEKYKKFYGERFYSSGMDLDGWLSDKKEKFEKYDNMTVKIDDVKVTSLKPKTTTVRFKQWFTGDSYSDYGIKTLTLEGCPGDYSIVREGWRALK